MTDGGQGGQSVTTLIGSQTKSSIKLGGGSYLVNPFKSSGKYVGDSVLSNVSNPVHHQGAASVDEDVSVGVIQGGAVVANRSISNNSSGMYVCLYILPLPYFFITFATSLFIFTYLYLLVYVYYYR